MKQNQIDKIVKAELDNFDEPDELPETQFSETPLPGFDQLLEPQNSHVLAAGMVVGHWRICKPIGRGGMSEVYLVERIDGQLSQKLALKIVHERLHSDSIQTRFLRERQILANLNHSHIASFIDAGISDSGLPWFVMEYVDGPNILDYCIEQQLPLESRIRLFRQVCEAMAHAHSNQVIHRDIKPSNILIDRAQKVVKLLDFGVASEKARESLTRTGAIIGTPGYMSPEQALGDQETLDEGSDLFSLGVLLYQLLCEKKPFSGRSFSEISHSIIHKEPDRLSAGIKPDLQAIIYRCLEKVRSNRYPSVNLLINDLDSFLQSRPVQARPITGVYRLYRLVQRNRIVSAAIGLALLAFLFAGGYSSYRSFQALKTIRASERMSYATQKLVNEVRRIHMMPNHSIASDYERVRQQLQSLERQLQSAPNTHQGQGNAALGAVYLALADFERARHFLDTSREQGWQTPQSTYDYGLTLISLWQNEKSALRSINDPGIKEKRLQQLTVDYFGPAILALESVRGKVSHSDFLEAQLANYAGDYTRAIAFGEKSIAANSWHYESHLLISEALLRRLTKDKPPSEYGEYIGDLNLAINHDRQAMEIARSDPLVYVNICGNASAQVQIFAVLHLDQKLEEVITKSTRACTRAIEIYPKSNSAYGNLAQILIASGDRVGSDLPESIALYQQALSVLDRGATQHPDSVRIMRDQTKSLVRIADYQREHQLPGIETTYERALSIADRIVQEDPGFDDSWTELARVQLSKADYLRDDLANYALAATLYQQSGENYLHANGLSKSVAKILNYAFTLAGLAETRRLQGRIGESLDAFASSIEARQGILRNKRPYLRYWLSALELSDSTLSMATEHGEDGTRFVHLAQQVSASICETLANGTESDPVFTNTLTAMINSGNFEVRNFNQCVKEYMDNHAEA